MRVPHILNAASQSALPTIVRLLHIVRQPHKMRLPYLVRLPSFHIVRMPHIVKLLHIIWLTYVVMLSHIVCQLYIVKLFRIWTGWHVQLFHKFWLPHWTLWYDLKNSQTMQLLHKMRTLKGCFTYWEGDHQKKWDCLTQWWYLTQWGNIFSYYYYLLSFNGGASHNKSDMLSLKQLSRLAIHSFSDADASKNYKMYISPVKGDVSDSQLIAGGGGTPGSDVTLHLIGVFVIVWCRTMHVSAGLAHW